jgi:hypothetical protein
MTDNGNGIWTYTATVNSVSTFQYKFINGNAWTGEEVVPMECGNPNGLGGYNRIFTVGNNDVILNTVCFSECAGCNTGADIAVTFQVDMSEVTTLSPNGVHLVGSFQNYDPAATPMVDQGNGIYSVQLPIPSGSFLFYRFINGNTNTEAETVPFTCGVLNNGGYYERVFQLDTAVTTLPLVCFSACEACGNDVSNLEENNTLEIYPNPAQSYFTIQFEDKINSILIQDMQGRILLQQNGMHTNSMTIPVDSWESGIYHVVINQSHHQQMVITK